MNPGMPEIGNVTVYADDIIDENKKYYDGYGYVLYQIIWKCVLLKVNKTMYNHTIDISNIKYGFFK